MATTDLFSQSGKSINPDLVIVCAGDHSLHRRYAENRTFDLWIIYYGDSDDVFREYERHSDRAFWRKGWKWELVRSLNEEHLRGERSAFEGYRYIFMPDDDIDFPGGAQDIQRLLAAAAAVSADIGQPAIANNHISRGWEPTRRVPDAFCHATNIVEIMAVFYSGRLFREIVLPAAAALDFLRSGWGFTVFVAKAAESAFRRPLRTFVFDTIPMIHTRPVGHNAELAEIGRVESVAMPGVLANRIGTYAFFFSEDAARAFSFPFIKETTNTAALAMALRGWADFKSQEVSDPATPPFEAEPTREK